MKNKTELILRMPQKELRVQLLFSQSLFFLLAIGLSLFLFNQLSDWFWYFTFDWSAIFLYGFLPAIILVIMEIIMYLYIPPRYFDDGGINEKIFGKESLGWIFLISLMVAVSEEMLFRGVIQVSFGYIFASSLFALIHVRYLKKPLLFITIVLTSFLLGYLFLITENLLVTIVFHFIVDFLLGVFIRYKK